MQPCGLRDLAHPRGRLSFGLKTKRFAGYARGTLAQRGLKKHSCNPAGCGIWRALGGDGRLASRPGNLRTESAVPLAERALKKTFMQPCGLRDLACPRGQLSFGLKAGQVAGCARGTLAQRGLKNISATLRAAGFGVPLGATVVWPQGRAICGLRPRHLGRKGSKKHSCNPAGCGIWRALGSDFRLVSRPDKLRAAPATGEPKEACSEADR